MADDGVLEVRVKIAARPETVYRFLSQPDYFRKWMGAGSSLMAEKGGELVVRYPTGDVAVGKVEEVQPGRSIVFTWGYEGSKHGLALGSTRVTIELQAVASGTLVTLRHEGLPTEQQRRDQRMGWRHYLSALAAAGASAQLDGRLAGLVEAYVGAWNETDAEKRRDLIAACWEERAVYRDAMGYVEGREHLNEYIGTARMFAPGIRLELAARADQCQGWARFPWKISAPDGKITARGTCFGEVSLDGRFVGVVGFWETPGAVAEGL